MRKHPMAMQKFRDAAKALKDMVARQTEFSAAAAVCVRAQGDPWLERTVLGI